MKRIKAIQDALKKETTGSFKSSKSPMNAAKFVNTARNVIFPSDAVHEQENHTDPDLSIGRIEQLKEELDDIIASECVLCGDMMIKSIDQPFIGNEEIDVATSWAI